jgi:hypothetical protein
MKSKIKIEQVCITPNGLYDEGVINLRIVDDGAGYYFEMSSDDGKIKVNPEEVSLLQEAAKMLLDIWGPDSNEEADDAE